MGKLTVMSVAAEKKPGRYGDGDGLSLLVGPTGSKSWILRIHHKGKRRDLGLGSASDVSLRQARKRAAEIRWQVKAGIGPTSVDKASGVPTFREATARYYSEHAAEPKGSKEGTHVRNWLGSIAAHAFPALGDVPIGDVDESAVLGVLAAVGPTRPVTASHLREGIPALIDWAVGKGYRETSLALEDIDKALPRRRIMPRRHVALGLAELPAFLSDLRAKQTIGRVALEALILTATRICDVRGMEWSQLDLDERLWRLPLPGGRRGRVHIISLSDAVVDVLGRARAYKRCDTDLVFRGLKRGRQLSKITLRNVALEMEYPITVQGFRRSFSDWVRENAAFPSEMREAALAPVGSATVAVAHSRKDYLEGRRALMEAWASYCLGIDGGDAIRRVAGR